LEHMLTEERTPGTLHTDTITNMHPVLNTNNIIKTTLAQ
jgi:hypothetical protein